MWRVDRPYDDGRGFRTRGGSLEVRLALGSRVFGSSTSQVIVVGAAGRLRRRRAAAHRRAGQPSGKGSSRSASPTDGSAFGSPAGAFTCRARPRFERQRSWSPGWWDASSTARRRHPGRRSGPGHATADGLPSPLEERAPPDAAAIVRPALGSGRGRLVRVGEADDSSARPAGGGTLAGNTHASAPLAVRMRPAHARRARRPAAPAAPPARPCGGWSRATSRCRCCCGARRARARRRSPRSSQPADRPALRRGLGGRRRRQGGAGRDRRRPRAGWPRPARRPCCSSTRCTGSPRPSRTRCCPGVENRWVTLVAATTENPFFSRDLAAAVPLAAADPRAADRRRRARRARAGR